jgi:hypothetical protein
VLSPAISSCENVCLTLFLMTGNDSVFGIVLLSFGWWLEGKDSEAAADNSAGGDALLENPRGGERIAPLLLRFNVERLAFFQSLHLVRNVQLGIAVFAHTRDLSHLRQTCQQIFSRIFQIFLAP